MLAPGPLEPTAISPLRPTPPLYGRGVPLYGTGKRQFNASGESAGTGQATDATGLSLSSETLDMRLEALRREHAERAPEMAYRRAGAQAARTMRGDGEDSTAIFSASSTQAFSPAETTARADGVHSEAVPQTDKALQPDQSDGLESRSASRTFMGSSASSQKNSDAGDSAGLGQNLTEEEQAEVEKLKARDREVRTHEQAHMSASGGLALGGASFQQERGPDGRMYAVGGEVQIDTSEGNSPEETIIKAQRIRRAALAPAQPSGQDRQVAAQASQMETEARQQKISGEDENGGGHAAGGTGRLAMRMEQAGAAYARTAGSFAPALWGTGISYAV